MGENDLPQPPESLLEADEDTFIPAPELARWATDAFIMDGPLFNPDHQHLAGVSIGFLLTNARNHTNGKQIIGTASLGDSGGGNAWVKGKREQQLREWFGDVPTFVITLDAHFLAKCTRLQACALIEHEMYHCSQKRDKYGCAVFNQKTGQPIYGMRPHDVEEFIGVVRRYGSWKKELEQFESALFRGPEVGQVKVDGYCGCGSAIS